MKNNYQKEKDFVKMIAAAIGISEEGSRVGVITFSGHAEHSIRMKGMGSGELRRNHASHSQDISFQTISNLVVVFIKSLFE